MATKRYLRKMVGRKNVEFVLCLFSVRLHGNITAGKGNAAEVGELLFL